MEEANIDYKERYLKLKKQVDNDKKNTNDIIDAMNEETVSLITIVESLVTTIKTLKKEI